MGASQLFSKEDLDDWSDRHADQIHLLNFVARGVFISAFRYFGQDLETDERSETEVAVAIHAKYREARIKIREIDSAPISRSERAAIMLDHRLLRSTWRSLFHLKRAVGNINFPEKYGWELIQACTEAGRVHELCDLSDGGVVDVILAKLQSVDGAAKGGLNSAKTRRAVSMVPGRMDLQKQKGELRARGVSEREVASLLARKYSCTPDYIRKILAGKDERANTIKATSLRD